MQIIRIIIMVVMATYACSMYAQHKKVWEERLEQIADVDDYESEMLERVYDALCELENNPINLNTATPEDLKQLLFLSDSQTEDLYEYLDRYRPVRSLGELLMIPSFDRLHFDLLSCFVYAGKQADADTISLSRLLQHATHEFSAALHQPLYERKGDRNGYLGYNQKHWFRYETKSLDRLRIGFVGSQDSGEPFFSPPARMGYDYYSFYLQLRNIKRLRNLVVGRYRLSAGKGLVVNTDISFGKTAILSSLGSTSANLRPHSSRSESNYFQGAAAEFSISKNLSATAFASYRPIDATLNKDGTIATILTSGYHRTQSETERRHNAHSLTAGAAMRLKSGNMYLGATVIHTSFDRPLRPDIRQFYRRYNPAGSTFTNAGINYGWLLGSLRLSGETAIADNGALATLNSMNIRLRNGISLLFLQRFYSYRYTALHANSFSDGGSVKNESGLYLGADWRLSGRWVLNAYTDVAYFACPRYQVSASAYSFDNMLSAIYSNSNWTFSARYRLRLRERDNHDKTALIYHQTHSARLVAAYQGKTLHSKTKLQLSVADSDKRSVGYMAGQSLGYNWQWLSAEASFSYFNTNDYDSRIYTSERGMLYSMASLMCYGRGIRYSLFARVRLTDRLMLLGKLGTTCYFDRSTIGSGLQQINASSITDLDLQVKWRF